MNNLKACFCLFFFFPVFILAQEAWVKGTIHDPSGDVVAQVKITNSVDDTAVYSDVWGKFSIQFSNLRPQDSLTLSFEKAGFKTQKIPLDFSSTHPIDLGIWTMFPTVPSDQEIHLTEFSEGVFNSLRQDDFTSNPLLSSQKTVLLETMAFQFRSSFFSARGLGSASQNLWLNGIKMNDFERGRPQWSQWGGLNDIINKSQSISYGLDSAFNADAGPLGAVTIDFIPSGFQKKSKLSMAHSNSSFSHRLYAVHHTGVLKNRWAFSFLTAHRWGEEGYVAGTSFQGTSLLFSAEHLWNTKNQSVFTVFYSPSERGRAAPLTQEVRDIKGRKYNPYWGWDKGKKRNARIRTTQLPVIHFRHFFQTKSWEHQLNLQHQFGHVGNSRIQNNGSQALEGYWRGGGINPDPTYYQNLPSYYLQAGQEDYASAYGAREKLEQNGQLDWATLRHANSLVAEAYTPYLLYDDLKKINRWSLSFLSQQKQGASRWNMYGHFTQNTVSFYAQARDFLGGKIFWDIDPFALNFDAAQNDLLQPNKQIIGQAPFQYNYDIKTQDILFGLQWKKDWINTSIHLEGNINPRTYQRFGKFKNGSFPDNSLGKGEPLSFVGTILKATLQWNISARKHLFFQAGYFIQPPPFSKLYVNPRINHETVSAINLEEVQSLSTTFIAQQAMYDFRLTPFWIRRQHINQIGFYFAEGIGGQAAFFVQEVLQGIGQENTGIESSLKVHLSDRYQLKSAVVWGNYFFSNNPSLQLYTTPSPEAEAEGFLQGKKDFGQSQLKGYRQGVGPQTAASLAIDYQDPSYWRFSMALNFFSQAYLPPSPLRRTAGFFQDNAGVLLPNISPQSTEKVLQQEKFPAYFVLNLTWNKSWRWKKRYINIFTSIQNVLDQHYKIGGFEQGRNANYTQLLNDQTQRLPLFGNKYWWGRGTSFFTTLSIQF